MRILHDNLALRRSSHDLEHGHDIVEFSLLHGARSRTHEPEEVSLSADRVRAVGVTS